MVTADPAQPVRPTVARLAFVVLTLITGAISAGLLMSVLLVGGLTWPEVALVTVHALLVLWIGANFWLSLFGTVRLARHDRERRAYSQERLDACRRVASEPPRTAIVMPIYNENPGDVFARVRAIYRSLERCGGVAAFDLFVLSDTRDPDLWLTEELEWVEACRQLGAGGRLFYRRRSENYERKPGNIRDFLERWGRHYRYMVVLDADSLLDGHALFEMVRRMECDSRLALLQTWPKLINGKTLFARCQQFAASLYGAPMIAGLAWLLGEAGNYWGHNAMIRVQAFMDNCGLPPMPGGGATDEEILSHDFVEAALLCRAGWKVRIAHDLPGSYEEGPPDILEHINRDRRWCRGNMQHLRLLGASGFRPLSRLNLFSGVMAYLAAPLWLLFLVTAVFAAVAGNVAEPLYAGAAATPPTGFQLPMFDAHTVMVVLLSLIVVLLLGPKLLGLARILISRAAREVHGGGFRVGLSVMLETVFSTLIAPAVLLHHAWFVAASLIKRGTSWGAQRREATGLTWRDACRVYGGAIAACGLLLAALAWASPGAMIWLTPILVSVLGGIPLAVHSSREHLGAKARAAGLFLIPEETEKRPDVLRLFDQENARPRLQTPSLIYRHLFLDPHFNAAHCALCQRQRHESSTSALRELNQLWIRGPGGMDAEEKIRALNDTENLRRIHAQLWTSRQNFGSEVPASPPRL